MYWYYVLKLLKENPDDEFTREDIRKHIEEHGEEVCTFNLINSLNKLANKNKNVGRYRVSRRNGPTWYREYLYFYKH